MTILAPLTPLSGTANTGTTAKLNSSLRGVGYARTTAIGEPRITSGGVTYVSVGGGEARTGITATGTLRSMLGLQGTANLVTTARQGQGVQASLLPVKVSASNSPIARINALLQPLTSKVSGPLPVPQYASIDNQLYPLASSGRMLTGQIGQVRNTLLPLEVKAATQPYAQIKASLLPLISKAFEGYPQNQAAWYEFLRVGMPLTTKTTHSASAYDTLGVTDEITTLLIMLATAMEQLNVSTTASAAAKVSVILQEILRVASSVGKQDEYSAMAMNIVNNASSTYEGFDMNSMTLWNGKYIAASENGIYIMDGNTDDGLPINASLTLGTTDYGTTYRKTISYVYVGAESEADATLAVKVDDGELYSYNLPASERLGTRRAVLGKGLRSRYWQLTVLNNDGADIEIDKIDAEAAGLTRRL